VCVHAHMCVCAHFVCVCVCVCVMASRDCRPSSMCSPSSRLLPLLISFSPLLSMVGWIGVRTLMHALYTYVDDHCMHIHIRA